MLATTIFLSDVIGTSLATLSGAIFLKRLARGLDNRHAQSVGNRASTATEITSPRVDAEDLDSAVLFPNNSYNKPAVDCRQRAIPCFDNYECFAGCTNANVVCVNGSCLDARKFENNECDATKGCLYFVVGETVTGTAQIACLPTNAIFTNPGCGRKVPFVCQCGNMDTSKNYAANAPVPSDCIPGAIDETVCHNTIVLAQNLGTTGGTVPVMLPLPPATVRRLAANNPNLVTIVVDNTNS